MVIDSPLSSACASLSESQTVVLREIVGQVAGRWPLWALYVLSESPAPLRFTRLLERIEGISQKMLTQTLRHLERDGLVSRKVFAEVPPHVEYALTEDGRALMESFTPFWQFLAGRLDRFEAARARFDRTT